MTTPVTEISYPSLDSQATYTFIDSQLSADVQTGDLNTDFREALYIQLGLSHPRGSSGYSIDDLWKRYVINSIAADSNTASGNPATAAGAGNPKGHKGNSMKHYYPPGLLKNPGNANKFPAATSPEVVTDTVTIGEYAVDGTQDMVVTMPTGVSPGDLLVYSYTISTTSTTGYPTEQGTSDWSSGAEMYAAGAGGTFVSGGMGYCVAPNPVPSTYTFRHTASGARSVIFSVMHVTGADGVTPRVQHAEDAGYNDSTPPIPELTGITVGNLLLIHASNSRATIDNITVVPPTGYTLIHGHYYGQYLQSWAYKVADQTTEAASAWPNTVSSSSGEWASLIAEFQ